MVIILMGLEKGKLYRPLGKKSSVVQQRISDGGDGGIRTHEPLRTTRFRVELVMTASIRLHVLISIGMDRRTREDGSFSASNELFLVALLRFFFCRLSESLNDFFVIRFDMREDAITAIFDPVSQYSKIAATVGQVQGAVTEKTIHIFQVVTWIVFTTSVFEIFVAHNASKSISQTVNTYIYYIM